MILEGTLREFPLRELLELMVFSSVNGALEINTQHHGPGYVYAHEGRLYHATLGDLSGHDAIWAFFEEQDAPFRFIAGEASAASSIFSDVKRLVEEGEQKARAWRAIRPRIPHLKLVPLLNPLPATNNVQISEDDWPVMAAIDGQRTIKEVAEHAFLDPIDTCRTLIRLVDQGLVHIVPPDQVPSSVEEAAPQPTMYSTSAADAGSTSKSKPSRSKLPNSSLIKPAGPRSLEASAAPTPKQAPSQGGTGLLSRLLANIPEEEAQEQQARPAAQPEAQRPAEESQSQTQARELTPDEQQALEQAIQEHEQILRILRGS